MQIGSRAFFKWAHFSLASIVNVHNIHQKNSVVNMKFSFLWRNVLTLNTLTFFKHFHMGIAKLIVTNMASHLFEKYVQSQPKNSAYNINISSISFNSNSKG